MNALASTPPVERRRPTGRLILVALPAILSLALLAGQIWWPAIGMASVCAILAATALPYRLNPLTQRKLRRFRSIRRGYYSFLTLLVISILTLFAELFVGGRALVVKYQGEYHFPVYGDVLMGEAFGLEGVDAFTPVNYRELEALFAAGDSGNWVLMPFVPYSPQEQTIYEGSFKPQPPTPSEQHYLGTDSLGRDIFSRLVYGIRIAVFFSLAYTFSVFLLGVTFGSLMGYIGKWFDLLAQRIVEIWSLLPFLYIVIIVYSLLPAGNTGLRITVLLSVMAAFGWIGMTYYMRTAMYREKERDYAAAAVLAGAGNFRIIFVHLLPNAISTIVTFLPFTVAAAITAVTALDFLGFGLPVPTPSIGELLKQGTQRLTAPWIVGSAFGTMVILLTLVTFIGEAVREAFDPKQFSYYR